MRAKETDAGGFRMTSSSTTSSTIDARREDDLAGERGLLTAMVTSASGGSRGEFLSGTGTAGLSEGTASERIAAFSAFITGQGLDVHAPTAPPPRSQREFSFPAGRLWFGPWPDVRRRETWPSPVPFRDLSLGVVMPAHNAALFILETASAVLSGLSSDDRLLIVENGSRDDTWNVLCRSFGTNAQVKLLRIPEGDAARARNCGVDNCDRELVGFCDADDVWSADKPAIVKALMQQTGADMLLHPMVTLRQDGIAVEGDAFLSRRLPRTNSLLGDLLVVGNFISTSAFTVRRDVLGRSPFSPGLKRTQDYEAWCRLARRVPTPMFAYLDEALAYYRYQGGLSQASDARVINVSGIVRRYAPGLSPRLRRMSLLRNAARVGWHALRLGNPALAWRALVAPPDPAIARDPR